MLKIEHGNDSKLIELARSVRQTVFIGEQGIAPELEYDELDPDCIHFVGMVDAEPVTTARLRPIGDGSGKSNGSPHLPRNAVTGMPRRSCSPSNLSRGRGSYTSSN